MKRSKFISEGKKSGPIEVPRRRSLVGRTEEEAAWSEDIVSGLDEQCLLLEPHLPLEKYRIRFQGNNYYFTQVQQTGNKLTIEAEAIVWHRPILPSDK
jgi:hypothetical protein